MEQTLDTSTGILQRLLSDKTTGGNICWATSEYAFRGSGYGPSDELSLGAIASMHDYLILPRAAKDIASQARRTRSHGEVFTPPSVCNAQINLIDEAWMGCRQTFNHSTPEGWETLPGPVSFGCHTWTDYVDRRVLEVTCGEAPYVTSRYDTVSGTPIALSNRIGMLDRKLRAVTERASDEREWLRWATRSLESVYAYDYQGDNVLVARENVLASYAEALSLALGRPPSINELCRASNVIAWNVWQMDGLSCTVPYHSTVTQLSLFGDTDDTTIKAPVLARVYDWRSKEQVTFKDLQGGAFR